MIFFLLAATPTCAQSDFTTATISVGDLVSVSVAVGMSLSF